MTQGTAPTGERYWLKQHQVTAFWHTFGISNGIDVPEEMTEKIYITKTGRYTDHETKGGRIQIRVKAEYMQSLLAHYIEKLEDYALSWDADFEHPNGIMTREAYLESEAGHESRLPIVKMIENLQRHRINDID